MKRQKLLRAIATLGAISLATWLVLPVVLERTLRSKAKENGWDISFTYAQWRIGEVRLHNVKASNEWIQADLDEVILSVEGTKLRAVRAEGGYLEADLRKRTESSGKGKSSIRTYAKGLTVEVRGLCGKGKIVALGVGKEEGRLSADRVSGTCRGWSFEAELVRKEEARVRAGKVLVKKDETWTDATTGKEPETTKDGVNPPEGIPNFDVRASEVRVETPSWHAKVLELRASRVPGETSAFAHGIETEGVQAWAEAIAVDGPQEAGHLTTHGVEVSAIRAPSGSGTYHILYTLKAKSVGGELDAIAKDRVEAKSVRVRGAVDEAALREGIIKDEQLSFQVGGVSASGAVTFKDRKNFSVHVSVPRTECQTVIDSAPTAFVDKIVGMKLSGTVEPELHVEGEGGKFNVKLRLGNRCRVESVPDSLSVKAFSKKFKRTVPGVNGDVEVESGPGSGSWTPLTRISPFMVKAVMTTEDTGFLVHRGVVEQSVANSMRENLEKGRFARGGSTVTMQLAKNLWLSRTKTIARKAQEFFLTTYLEQSLTKEEIMELYLNVVEFGPEVYGIKQAADHYFGKEPMELTVAEAAFLASVLPSPKRERFAKDGTLTPWWDEWIKTIVKTMRKRELIDDREEAEGLKEPVRRGLQTGAGPVTVKPGGVDPRSWH